MICKKKQSLLDENIYKFIMLALIVDIGGGFGLKYLSFLIILIYILLSSIKYKYYKISKNWIQIEGTIFIFIPIIMMLSSILFRGVSIGNSIGAITAYITWIIYPLIIRLNHKTIINTFMQIMYYMSIIMICTFIIIYLLNLLGRNSDIWNLTLFSRKYSLGYLGLKKINEAILFPDIFYRFSFLIIPATILWSNVKEKKYKMIICLLASIATTSTGIITFTIIGIVCTTMNRKTRNNAKDIVFIMLFIIIFILIISKYINIYEIMNFILGKFDSSNNSTSIKILHIKSIIETLYTDPTFLLFGTGLGSEFYSMGVGKNVINVEVSQLNFIRQFGIIYASIFFIYILSLCLKLKNTDGMGNKLMISILCLFFACATNPLLISPVFFLMLVMGRAYVEKYHMDTNNKNLIKGEREYYNVQT